MFGLGEGSGLGEVLFSKEMVNRFHHLDPLFVKWVNQDIVAQFIGEVDLYVGWNGLSDVILVLTPSRSVM